MGSSVDPIESAPVGALASRLRADVAEAVGIMGALSAVLNVLALSGSFFMLLVYDRVLPSHSLPTLVGLVAILIILYVFQALLELTRQRLLMQVGVMVDARLSGPTYDAAIRLGASRGAGEGLQISRDLDQLRSFISGAGPIAAFDLPFMLLYIGICFAFHWMIGTMALAGAVVLVSLTFFAERLTEAPLLEVARKQSARNNLLLMSAQSAEVARAMGMDARLKRAWMLGNEDYLASQHRATKLSSGLGAVTRTFRMFLQSGVLALGAYLVIEQKATGGIIIASSILTSRALAPVEQAIANLKPFISARQSWSRLSALFASLRADVVRTELPPPERSLTVEAVSISPPENGRLVVQEVSFGLRAGSGLAVLGASGSGKSSLVKALAGAWPIAHGAVRLDGAATDQWTTPQLGKYVGYLPQNVQLMGGTVAQNIARFDSEVSSDAVVAAAQDAFVHELIVGLPNGYETLVAVGGGGLAAGQSQRVALARALLGRPFLVVLDEPNSNLDPEGEAALNRAIVLARQRGAIVVVVAHRQSALAGLDQVLVMHQGRMQAFGPKDAVLAKMFGQPPVRTRPVIEGQ